MSALCTLKHCIVLTKSHSVSSNNNKKKINKRLCTCENHWFLQFIKLKKPGKMNYLGKDNKGLLLKNTTLNCKRILKKIMLSLETEVLQFTKIVPRRMTILGKNYIGIPFKTLGCRWDTTFNFNGSNAEEKQLIKRSQMIVKTKRLLVSIQSSIQLNENIIMWFGKSMKSIYGLFRI